MAIQEQKDPRTRKPFLEASGVVSGVFYNELKNIKSYAGKQGAAWTPTHSVSVIIDNDRISLGLFEKTDKRPELRCKDVDGNYHTLAKGAEVSVVVERGEDYNDKPQYSARSGDVLILTPAPVQAANQPQGPTAAPYQKKDMTGVHVGHSINVAINVKGVAEAQELIETAKEAHALTEKLRTEYKGKFPEMSDYDIGASVGQAVLSASSYVDEVALIEPYARQTLDEVVPAVKKFIQEFGKEATLLKEKVTPAKKTVAKKTTPKAAAVVEEPSGFDDMDDDIPF